MGQLGDTCWFVFVLLLEQKQSVKRKAQETVRERNHFSRSLHSSKVIVSNVLLNLSVIGKGFLVDTVFLPSLSLASIMCLLAP